MLGAIQRKAPADYFSPDQLPPSKKRFEPRGKFLGDYSSYGLGRTREQHAAVESERGGDVRYEVFEIQAGPEMGCVVFVWEGWGCECVCTNLSSHCNAESPHFLYRCTNILPLGSGFP